MAIWWLKVAEEIEAMRHLGVERPQDFIFNGFSGKSDAPTIETTHRVVERKDRSVALLENAGKHDLPKSPEGIDEKRFRDNERLVDNGRSESFLKRPIKRARWL
jgi:hypothetical protein